MKNIKSDQLIDTTQEAEALYEFTKKRWEGLDDQEVKTIIDYSFKAGLEAAKYWIEPYSLMNTYNEWTKTRTEPKNWLMEPGEEKEATVGLVRYYDDIYKIGESLLSSSSKYKDIIMKDWDFSSKSDILAKEVLTLVPNAKKYKPKGYAILRKGYQDHDGFEEYDDKYGDLDFEEFNGINSSSACAGGYHERIKLPSVVYDDVCQGRNPLRVLTSAAFAHGLTVASHNNSVEILSELNLLKKHYLQPQYFAELIYLGDLTTVANNKILKAILFTHTLQEREEQEYKDQRSLTTFIKRQVYKQLNSPQLTEAELLERKNEVAQMIKKVLSQKPTAEEEFARKENEKLIASEVLAFLNKIEKKPRL